MSGAGVDIGGTFTDVVGWDGTALRVEKRSTTADQSVAVVEGAAAVLAGRRVPTLVHGTTVATNALLERAGAVTALVTDPGFEHLIEIGRQSRPSLYDPFADPAAPVVPRERRFGWDGSEATLRAIRESGAEAVAVCLLHSYADGSPEEGIAAALAGPAGSGEAAAVDVSLSHRVAPEFREFERASTTTVNAYLRPRVAAYLARLESGVVPAHADRVRVMRSSGGTVSTAEAARLAASILLSGPAGGVVAAAALGSVLESAFGTGMVTFDMGGTSTDVARIEDGRPEVTYERLVDGLAVRMPSVGVHTVGAGGGSLGWIDSGGALRVGPRSAGAQPGPACYGRGGVEPAVTDADLVLGMVGERLAGGVQLDRRRAAAALERLGNAVRLDARAVARGMVEVVEATMERAVRTVSVEEGADPRQAVLVAFGGAGGLHATALARRLEMRGVAVPPHAGVFSALGLLMAPPRMEDARSVLLGSDDGLDAVVGELADRTVDGLRAETGSPPARVETTVDVRYAGQAHETPVPYIAGTGWEALAAAFHAAHRHRNGFARPDDPIEAVTVRAVAIGRPVLGWDRLPGHRPVGEPGRGTRWVDVAGEAQEARVVWRPGLEPGAEVAGPAVVEDPDSTTWLAPGERAVLHDSGTLLVEW